MPLLIKNGALVEESGPEVLDLEQWPCQQVPINLPMLKTLTLPHWLLLLSTIWQ